MTHPSESADLTKLADPNMIASDIAGLWRSPPENRSQALELQQLLDATNSRATGVWRVLDQRLKLAAFLAVRDMPTCIQYDFLEVTGDVGLNQVEFGIVQAVVSRGPAINHRSQPNSIIRNGSIGWLDRFEAASSLAVPLLINNTIIGAVAVATARTIQSDDSTCQFLSMITDSFAAQKLRFA